MPDITAITRDGIRLGFSCSESAYVLDAAEEAGLYLPSVCRHGRCGTCRAVVVSGNFHLAPHEAALPAAPGSVLLCRCLPHENLVVELPCRDAQIGRRKVPERHAQVEAVNPAAEGWVTLSLRLRPEGEYGHEAEFSPGQHMELRIPGAAQWREIAMVNLPNAEGLLEFLLPTAKNTPFAAWAAAARRGAVVELRGPLGKFALDEASPHPRCFVGAGAGMAPLLAMLRQLAAGRDRTRMYFIFEADIAQLPLLERSLAALRAALPQLTVALAPGGAAAALSEQLAKLSTADIYASGPGPMLAAVAAAARAHGVPEARIRVEPCGGMCGGTAGMVTGA